MSTRELWSGIGFGLLASTAGTIVIHATSPWLGGATAMRGSMLLLALATALWTLWRSPVRIGRVVTACAWLLVLAALVLFDPSLGFWLLATTVAWWLTRSLYRYQHLTQAAIDALLAGFAVLAAVAALRSSHSLFLALWSYYLVQALTALIPASTSDGASRVAAEEDRFDRARRNAESALRRAASPNRS